MTLKEKDVLITSEEFCRQIGLTPLLQQQEEDHRELVRRHCLEVYSSSPSHQARAAKNTKYWDELGTMGGLESAREKGLSNVFSKTRVLVLIKLKSPRSRMEITEPKTMQDSPIPRFSFW